MPIDTARVRLARDQEAPPALRDEFQAHTRCSPPFPRGKDLGISHQGGSCLVRLLDDKLPPGSSRTNRGRAMPRPWPVREDGRRIVLCIANCRSLLSAMANVKRKGKRRSWASLHAVRNIPRWVIQVTTSRASWKTSWCMVYPTRGEKPQV